MPFDLSDDERRIIYVNLVLSAGRTRGNNVAAFFKATFEAWKDYKQTGEQTVYVGYSPIIIVDADKILCDFPQAHVLHVVRNPWSAFADTKKRPSPLSLNHYMLGWTMNQYYALHFQTKYPDRVHVIRIEDVMTDAYANLSVLCMNLGVEPADSLRKPTWNGIELEEIYPWGTLRKATLAENQATSKELTDQERAEIRAYAWQYLETFDYKNICK